MDKQFLQTLVPFLGTRPMYGVFAIEDGSGWFCSSCGRKSETAIITHKDDCKDRAHGRARQALATALMDAGIDVVA